MANIIASTTHAAVIMTVDTLTTDVPFQRLHYFVIPMRSSRPTRAFAYFVTPHVLKTMVDLDLLEEEIFQVTADGEADTPKWALQRSRHRRH
jgi:hypothetical protein